MKFTYKVEVIGLMADGSNYITDIQASCIDELYAILDNAFSECDYNIIEHDDPTLDYDFDEFDIIEDCQPMTDEEYFRFMNDTYDDEIIDKTVVYKY